MNQARPLVWITLALAASTSANAIPSNSVACSYAPSQSSVVAAISGAAGGSAAAAGAVAAATGTVVAGSRGALIFTGSPGYIAGTNGAAVSVPVIVEVGVVVGGARVTLELVCVSENQPTQVAKVHKAAEEFSRRFSTAMKRTTVATGEARMSVTPRFTDSPVRVKHVAKDAWTYANRASVAVGKSLGS